jgi:glycosyltransferase involved in cell wall biosynthesis
MAPLEVLHVLGYDEDRGGILTAIRVVAAESPHRVVLGVNAGFAQRRRPELPGLALPRLEAERIDAGTLLAALRVAVRLLATDRPARIVHGQSRAGLIVAAWLWFLGHDRVVASPHSYGRHRWLYRWLALCLGDRWRWLSPAMRRHYGAGAGWTGCIPEPMAGNDAGRIRSRRDGPIVLGGAGLLVEWKGWHVVLEALGRLEPAVRDQLRFRHAGDCDGSPGSRQYRRKLEEDTRRLGLDGIVEWRGWCADMGGFWSGVDAAVVSSFGEPMALAGLEALAAGCPLILADSGGLADVVPPEAVLGFRTGDAASLADVLRGVVAQGLPAVPETRPRRVQAAAVAAAWRETYASAAGREARALI